MREEILAAIDKIEDEYLIDDNYVRYPDTVHEFQTAADKLMTISKGCDAFWMAEILSSKGYNEILGRINELMENINSVMLSYENYMLEKMELR